MSGGVGPCSDIRLPHEEEDAKTSHDTSFSKSGQKPHAPKSLLTLRQLNVLAVIVVLAASGMVSATDFAFVIFSFIYMAFLSKVAFPALSPSTEPPVFGQNNRVLGLYVTFAAVIGLFLPIAYIFEGIVEGDKEGIKAAAPHVFLLASQVFMEGVTFRDCFSLPIRVFVPVIYNSIRIFSIMDWLSSEFSKVKDEYGGSARRLYVGRGLAIANMALWCFNLFGFLLPVYLPKAFKIYYSKLLKKN
ncbi:uncharacterized protein LOC132271778 [Cornus florida]|uniref:uncharacterized protein LOC132271778 n=1 Tax=Cornus florida TaxID=4283 RepID=UPI002896C887|nr:uncharacterized protein LOC132271778 [Cornus florida]